MVSSNKPLNLLLLMLGPVTFDSISQGQVVMVIYEWSDVQYLGKVTSTVGDLPVSTFMAEYPITNRLPPSRKHMSAHRMR